MLVLEFQCPKLVTEIHRLVDTQALINSIISWATPAVKGHRS